MVKAYSISCVSKKMDVLSIFREMDSKLRKLFQFLRVYQDGLIESVGFIIKIT